MGTSVTASLWRLVRRMTIIAGVTLGSANGALAELTLAVHPVLPPTQTQKLYQPLVNYLTDAIGEKVSLITNPNFLVHWQVLRRGKYDLILDGPHFTDYRASKMGYTVLAKLPDVVSYTLVANEDAFILEPSDLIGKPVATSPSPALGALRLAQIYPNPLRQPRFVEADDSAKAAEMAVAGKTVGAIIPAPLVGRYPTLTTVATTPQVPSPAISASPDVPADTQAKLKQALLNAQNSEAGQAALAALNINAFQDANNDTYQEQMHLLEGVWGF